MPQPAVRGMNRQAPTCSAATHRLRRTRDRGRPGGAQEGDEEARELDVQDRAQPLDSPLADIVSVTVHPSSILRVPDSDARAAAYAQFVGDLRRIVRRATTKRAGGNRPRT